MAAPRIVSLLPSATEICFALGLGEQLVGVSHECDFPVAARRLPVLTAAEIDVQAPSAEIDRQVRARASDGLSLYRVDEERLRALAPDLIITQDACAVCAVPFAEVQAAARRLFGDGVTVLSLAPLRVADVWGDVERVAVAAGVAARGVEVAARLRARLDALAQATAALPRRRVLVLEWLAPPMVGGRWTPELIRAAGGEPLLGHDGAPTAAIDPARLIDAAPDVVLIAPCGFALAQTRREAAALAAAPWWPALAARARVVLADGNAFFNRPGPRLVESAELAAAAIHPEHFAARDGMEPMHNEERSC